MQTDRSIALGLRRGFFTRCPACGEGALFGKYLKVEPTCKACGHDNGQYRADDARKRGRFPGGLGARHPDEGRQAGYGRRTRHGEAVAEELVE